MTLVLEFVYVAALSAAETPKGSAFSPGVRIDRYLGGGLVVLRFDHSDAKRE
jgi:hypothetical protein